MTPFVDATVGPAEKWTSDPWPDLLHASRVLSDILSAALPPECPDDGGLLIIGKPHRLEARHIRRLAAAVDAMAATVKR